MNLPSLPLAGSRPDPASEGMTIEFRFGDYGVVTAIVINAEGMKHDEVRGHSMREVYDVVREQYPQATWNGGDE